MKVQGDMLIFSTGKILSANGGIIGLRPDMGVTGGWDDLVHDDDNPSLTKQEQTELADYMIEQWKKFRDAA